MTSYSSISGRYFEKWEADFGRTFVLGSDPLKHKMQQDVGHAFAEGKRYFNETSDITSSELFRYAKSLAEKLGWEFGGPIAGHLIGQFRSRLRCASNPRR
jgi:Xaa-Pro dipeptidase